MVSQRGYPNGRIPAPIAITAGLKSGSRITPDDSGSYTFAWTGGDATSVVWVQLVIDGVTQVQASASAAAGSLSLYGYPPCYCGIGNIGPCEGGLPAGHALEVIITQGPPQTPSLPFNAPGQEPPGNYPVLGMGGELTWTYIFDFKGLTS